MDRMKGKKIPPELNRLMTVIMVFTFIETMTLVSFTWGPILVRPPAEMNLYWLLLAEIPLAMCVLFIFFSYTFFLNDAMSSDTLISDPSKRKTANILLGLYVGLEILNLIGSMTALIWRIILFSRCAGLEDLHECKLSVHQNVALSALILCGIASALAICGGLVGIIILLKIRDMSMNTRPKKSEDVEADTELENISESACKKPSHIYAGNMRPRAGEAAAATAMQRSSGTIEETTTFASDHMHHSRADTSSVLTTNNNDLEIYL